MQDPDDPEDCVLRMFTQTGQTIISCLCQNKNNIENPKAFFDHHDDGKLIGDHWTCPWRIYSAYIPSTWIPAHHWWCPASDTPDSSWMRTESPKLTLTCWSLKKLGILCRIPSSNVRSKSDWNRPRLAPSYRRRCSSRTSNRYARLSVLPTRKETCHPTHCSKSSGCLTLVNSCARSCSIRRCWSTWLLAGLRDPSLGQLVQEVLLLNRYAVWSVSISFFLFSRSKRVLDSVFPLLPNSNVAELLVAKGSATVIKSSQVPPGLWPVLGALRHAVCQLIYQDEILAEITYYLFVFWH